eukprot:g44875.t1
MQNVKYVLNLNIRYIMLKFFIINTTKQLHYIHAMPFNQDVAAVNEHLKLHPQADAADIANATGLTINTVRRLLFFISQNNLERKRLLGSKSTVPCLQSPIIPWFESNTYSKKQMF